MRLTEAFPGSIRTRAVENRRARIEQAPLPEHSRFGEIHRNHFDTLNTADPRQLRIELFGAVAASGMLAEDPEALAKIQAAEKVARDAHKTDIRKFSGQEYIVHPYRVAHLAMDLAREMGVKPTAELVAGALLHDVVEDTLGMTENSLAAKLKKHGTFARTAAADSSALDHNTIMGTKLEASDYVDKITRDVDQETLLRRLIIKTADRGNNLIDPPHHPTGELADDLLRSRRKMISRTGTELFPELLEVTEAEQGTEMEEFKQTLQLFINESVVLSQATIDDPNFTTSDTDKYFAAAA